MTREEARDRAHAYLVGSGRIDLSLRTLGAAIGVSARMLVHYFGNRETLLLEVLDLERVRQREMIRRLAQTGLGPVELLRVYFHHITEPGSRSRIRFFFDLVAEAGRRPEAYHRFLTEDLVGYWKMTMSTFAREAGIGPLPEDIASLALAAARGLYLELLAEGNTEAVRRAYDRQLSWIAAELGPTPA